MLRKIFSITFFASLFITAMAFIPQAYAQTNYSAGPTISLNHDQTINNDYYAAGSTVILDGNVNGDVYVAGGYIIINGRVNGDVLGAGGTIAINGNVTGNVRTIGGQTVLAGDIGRNVSVAGGSVTILKSAKIAGSVTAAAGNLSLLAPVGKGITLAAGQANIDSAVDGNVMGAVRQLIILPEASISGKLTYWSNNSAQIASSSVHGGIVYHHTNWETQKSKTENKGGIVWFSLFGAVIGLVTSFVIGLLLLEFFPTFTNNIYTTVTTKPWNSLGIGFLTIVLMPFAFIVLLMTIIGIPLAFILLIMFILVVMLNGVFISYVIGKKILPQKNILALLVGLVINGIISIIPFIGWIWSLATLFIGIGAIVIVEKELYRTLREKKIM